MEHSLVYTNFVRKDWERKVYSKKKILNKASSKRETDANLE